MENILVKFNLLSGYAFLLPGQSKLDFVNDLEISKINIISNPRTLYNLLDSFLVYSFFLPDFSRESFIKDLELIKKELLSVMAVKTGNSPPPPPPPRIKSSAISMNKDFSPKDSLPSVTPFVGQEDNEKISKETFPLFFSETTEQKPIDDVFEKTVPVTDIKLERKVLLSELIFENNTSGQFSSAKIKENTLYFVCRFLVPKLTKKGFIMVENPSTPANQLRILKSIDQKSSITDLYSLNCLNYQDFLDFLNFVYVLGVNQYIDFTKTQVLEPQKAWVKIGSIFEECNLVSPAELNLAFAYMKENKGIRLGEALTKLGVVSAETVHNVFKIQKWFSALIEHAVYTESFANDLPFINGRNTLNLLDFIIPFIRLEVSEKLDKLNNPSLSSFLKLITGNDSLIKVFNNNKDSFQNLLADYLKIIFKLNAQGLIDFKANKKIKDRTLFVKFAEMSSVLGFINEKNIFELFSRDENQRQKNLIAKSLLEDKLMSQEQIELTLSLQKSLNRVLLGISLETNFVMVFKSVFSESFNIDLTTGNFAQGSFGKRWGKTILVRLCFRSLNEKQLYFIFDKNFAKKLSNSFLSDSFSSEQNADEKAFSLFIDYFSVKIQEKLQKNGLKFDVTLEEIDFSGNYLPKNEHDFSLIQLTSGLDRLIVGFFCV